MAALSADTIRDIGPGGWYETHPVKASTTIYENGMVCLDSNGLAVAAADTSSYTFAGVAMQHVDNSSGSNGDETVLVYFGPFKVDSATTETQANCQVLAYVSDDDNIDDVGNVSNYVLVGIRTRYVDSDTVWVDPRRRVV